jgi:hypothetical protein
MCTHCTRSPPSRHAQQWLAEKCAYSLTLKPINPVRVTGHALRTRHASGAGTAADCPCQLGCSGAQRMVHLLSSAARIEAVE